ncbi:MAG TPA: hypothetical protein VIM70_12435 [Clostridium sp.]|uniref:hypothetical protein n=1 Tax=Clostridium sp. TaxID=1506 RepID=UPI002F94059E
MDYKIINNGYEVESNYDLTQEFKENAEKIINWFNFRIGSKFYDKNDNEYMVQEVSHDSKYIKLS